ncbi:MAG: 23S rRNA (pseudouridine(1915)-N(3))-methyltransferase RlmH [Bdellovibrionales bacterium]|nr:23S rRNA (pseudouridine(1915)-N(3))-methyltransferase RlmH [Bdellovibrionales bacterium]
MKLKFYIFETKAPAWVETARAEYAAKISPFFAFEVQTLKSPSADRDSAEVKRRKEAEILLKQLDDRDLLILFDEGGKVFRSSEEFSDGLVRAVESGKARVVFCIGGPYGFSAEVKARAQMKWSLSPLTMNHWIAQLMALEQIYRGFTIMRGIPYHNR